jgi:hypothetical protein
MESKHKVALTAEQQLLKVGVGIKEGWIWAVHAECVYGNITLNLVYVNQNKIII